MTVRALHLDALSAPGLGADVDPEGESVAVLGRDPAQLLAAQGPPHRGAVMREPRDTWLWMHACLGGQAFPWPLSFGLFGIVCLA